MSVESVRRYYLLKRLYARREDLEEGIWKGKQESESGSALPSDFPSLTELVAAGYSTVEDLTGADTDELEEFACITKREAEAVLTALDELS